MATWMAARGKAGSRFLKQHVSGHTPTAEVSRRQGHVSMPGPDLPKCLAKIELRRIEQLLRTSESEWSRQDVSRPMNSKELE